MLLPILWVGVAKYYGKGYDNSKPREWLEKLDGMAARANWAQANSFEAFPPFAAAVIIAHQTGAAQMTIDIMAGAFIIARIAHGVCYIRDQSTARSFVWLAGFFLTFGLFLI
jgi:uncharacterized MAPEG superfamily protein